MVAWMVGKMDASTAVPMDSKMAGSMVELMVVKMEERLVAPMAAH